MNLQNPFRAELQRIPYLNDAIDTVLARINALWPVQHNADGTHGDVTAETLTVTGDTTVEEVVAAGELIELREVYAPLPTIGPVGASVVIKRGTASWSITHGSDGLVFIYATSFDRVMALLEISAGVYALYPVNATATCQLGYSSAAFAECHTQTLDLEDGISAPSTTAGRARLYVDSADGDLKVKFGDGTVKTIVTDT